MNMSSLSMFTYYRYHIIPGIHCFAVKNIILHDTNLKKTKNYPTTYLTPTAQNTPQTNNQPLCFTPSFYHHYHNHCHCHHHHHCYHSTLFVCLAASGSCRWRSTSDPNNAVPLSQGKYKEDTEREGTDIVSNVEYH